MEETEMPHMDEELARIAVQRLLAAATWLWDRHPLAPELVEQAAGLLHVQGRRLGGLN